MLVTCQAWCEDIAVNICLKQLDTIRENEFNHVGYISMYSCVETQETCALEVFLPLSAATRLFSCFLVNVLGSAGLDDEL